MTAITHARLAGAGGSGLARYREALRTPGALGFAIPAVVGRMPMAMLSLALVILLTAVTGSYGIAGAVSAAAALLYAAVTPFAARLADRYGQARVLRPQVIIFAAATAALAACAMVRAPVWALAVTGGLSRAAMPSLGPMVRSRWSQLLAGTALLDAAFSLEGIADELIFIVGPVLVVALAAGVSPVAGVLITAALSVVGVAGLTRQRRSEPPAAPVTRSYGPALRSPGLRVLIGMTVCLGALFVAVDLATIAFAAHHGAKAAAGPLLGLYGLGSAIAGVWYGTRHWRAPHASRLTAALAATVLGVAPLAFMPGIWPMAIAITAAGLGISATLASSYRVAEMAVPAGQRTEAMSWLTTAAATGTALGAPLAGHLIDAFGAPAGYLFAVAAGLIAVAITLPYRRRLTALPGPRPGNPDMTATARSRATRTVTAVWQVVPSRRSFSLTIGPTQNAHAAGPGRHGPSRRVRARHVHYQNIGRPLR
jgi:MFS family permease